MGSDMNNMLPLSQIQTWSAVPLPPDTSYSLLYLIGEYTSQRLVKAPHQRTPDAWTFKKKQRWIDRLRDFVAGKRQAPLGVFCIYRLISEECKTAYLNEGLQRLYAGLEAMTDPTKYGFRDKEEVECLLGVIYMPIQNRHYTDHLDAAADFEDVNNGVGLHKAEKYVHHMVYYPEWEAIWKHQFERFKHRVEHGLASFSQLPTKRGARLSRDRSTRHLFAVAANRRPLQGNDDKPDVELSCVKAFRHKTPDDVSDMIRRCESYLAEIETAWRSIPGISVGHQLNDRVARWCLGVMLVNDDGSVPVAFWQPFFKKLFERTKSGSSTNLTSESGNAVFLTDNFGAFRSACRALGIEAPEKPPRRPKADNIKRGFNDHHVQPFVDYGHGPTEPLPARLNAALNARSDIKKGSHKLALDTRGRAGVEGTHNGHEAVLRPGRDHNLSR